MSITRIICSFVPHSRFETCFKHRLEPLQIPFRFLDAARLCIMQQFILLNPFLLRSSQEIALEFPPYPVRFLAKILPNHRQILSTGRIPKRRKTNVEHSASVNNCGVRLRVEQVLSVRSCWQSHARMQHRIRTSAKRISAKKKAHYGVRLRENNVVESRYFLFFHRAFAVLTVNGIMIAAHTYNAMTTTKHRS